MTYRRRKKPICTLVIRRISKLNSLACNLSSGLTKQDLREITARIGFGRGLLDIPDFLMFSVEGGLK